MEEILLKIWNIALLPYKEIVLIIIVVCIVNKKILWKDIVVLVFIMAFIGIDIVTLVQIKWSITYNITSLVNGVVFILLWLLLHLLRFVSVLSKKQRMQFIKAILKIKHKGG